MANIKISELNELTQKENNDFLPIVDSSANETKKISVGNLTPSNDKLVHVGTSVDGDYRVNVLKSKNLIAITLNSQDAYLIPCKRGDTYTFSFNGSTTANDKRLFLRTYNGAFSSTLDSYVDNETITLTGSNAKYSRTITCTVDGFIYIRTASNYTTYTLSNIQLEKGSTATPYEPYITPSINVDNEMLVSKNVYSTNEVVVGEWFGKPLYRKVIDCGALPNNTTKAINHNVTNVDYMVKVEGVAWNPTIKNAFPLNLNRPSSATSNIGLWYDETQIKIETATDRSAWTKTYVILEYTKTTD